MTHDLGRGGRLVDTRGGRRYSDTKSSMRCAGDPYIRDRGGNQAPERRRGDSMGMWVGRGRKARVAYGFDDIALVPGALTVNPNEVDVSWDLCGRRFAIPIIAAAMDGAGGPTPATETGRHGALAVLNLEGIFSRYERPEEALDRIVSASPEEATKLIQSIYG